MRKFIQRLLGPLSDACHNCGGSGVRNGMACLSCGGSGVAR